MTATFIPIYDIHLSLFFGPIILDHIPWRPFSNDLECQKMIQPFSLHISFNFIESKGVENLLPCEEEKEEGGSGNK